MFTFSKKKVGGITFIKLWRLNISFSIARKPAPTPVIVPNRQAELPITLRVQRPMEY